MAWSLFWSGGDGVVNDASCVYEFPAYYESVFHRDFEKETDFFEACLHRYGTSTDRSLIELGCGPASNARAFARRGWRSIGLDLSPAMLAYAEREARREQVSVELVEGDLLDFDLDAKVALAICPLETICLVVNNDDLVRHLRAVARNLTEGGVYVIENTHPRFFLDRYTGDPHRGRLGDLDVELTWGFPEDRYDSIGQWYQTTVELVVRRGDEVVVRKRDSLPQRWYPPQELRALVELSGAFSEVHFHGTNRLPFMPLTSGPEGNAMLAVLVKR